MGDIFIPKAKKSCRSAFSYTKGDYLYIACAINEQRVYDILKYFHYDPEDFDIVQCEPIKTISISKHKRLNKF